MLNQDWDIKARGADCRQCGTAFVEAQAYMSRLGHGDDGYVRGDFCLDCWARRETFPDQTISVWRGLFHAPPPPAEEPLKKETAEELLRKLIAKGDSVHRNVIFILAVMIERRRVLIEKDVQRCPDGTALRIYEHRKTGETFLITDPALRLDQLAQVQAEVVAMLSGGAENAEERQALAEATAEAVTVPAAAVDEAVSSAAVLEPSKPDETAEAAGDQTGNAE